MMTSIMVSLYLVVFSFITEVKLIFIDVLRIVAKCSKNVPNDKNKWVIYRQHGARIFGKIFKKVLFKQSSWA